MDILTAIAQLTARQDDQKKGAVTSAGTAPLEAEFANLTTDGVQLVSEDAPPNVTSEAADTGTITDIVSELLEKMTGITGAVAAPGDQADGEGALLARSGVSGVVATHEVPTDEAGDVADHEAQTGIVAVMATPVGQTDKYSENMIGLSSENEGNPRTNPTKAVMAPPAQLENSGSGQQTLTPLDIEESKIQTDKSQQPEQAPKDEKAVPPRPADSSSDYSKMANPSKKVQVEISYNRQVSQLFAARSSAPDASPQNDPDIEAKQSLRETSALIASEPLSKAYIVEFVNKPITAAFAESRTIGQELSVSDSARLSVDVKPVQVNPPALFRQITDAVVTRRDEIVEIRLSPEELGRVRMILSGQERNPNLTIWVDRPEVLEQMRRQGDQLLQQLREQGLSASLDFRDGRQARDGSEQKLALTQRQNSAENTPELKSLASATELSRITPTLSGRQGINIRV